MVVVVDSVVDSLVVLSVVVSHVVLESVVYAGSLDVVRDVVVVVLYDSVQVVVLVVVVDVSGVHWKQSIFQNSAPKVSTINSASRIAFLNNVHGLPWSLYRPSKEKE